MIEVLTVRGLGFTERSSQRPHAMIDPKQAPGLFRLAVLFAIAVVVWQILTGFYISELKIRDWLHLIFKERDRRSEQQPQVDPSRSDWQQLSRPIRVNPVGI
jgi:hypothetical protein